MAKSNCKTFIFLLMRKNAAVRHPAANCFAKGEFSEQEGTSPPYGYAKTQQKSPVPYRNGAFFVSEKPASTYFHRPFPANYLRHK